MGETPFELFIVLLGDLTKGVIRGSVDGHPVARRGSGRAKRARHGPGVHTGPPALLALTVGHRRLLFVRFRGLTWIDRGALRSAWDVTLPPVVYSSRSAASDRCGDTIALARGSSDGP